MRLVINQHLTSYTPVLELSGWMASLHLHLELFNQYLRSRPVISGDFLTFSCLSISDAFLEAIIPNKSLNIENSSFPYFYNLYNE